MSNNKDVFDDFDDFENFDQDDAFDDFEEDKPSVNTRKRTSSKESSKDAYFCSKCSTEIDKMQRIDGNQVYCKHCKEIVIVSQHKGGVVGDSEYEIKKTSQGLDIKIDFFNRSYGMISFIFFILTFMVAINVGNVFVSFIAYLLTFMALAFALTFSLNYLYLHMDKKKIQVYASPVPFMKSKTFHLKNIDQIYVKEYAKVIGGSVRDRYGVIMDYFEVKEKHVLMIRYKNGKEHALIPPMSDLKYLISIERNMESWLGIRDKKVDSETRYK